MNILTNPMFYGMILATLGGILGILSLLISIYAIIEVKALMKSTHSIQYMPIDPKIDAENEEILNEWATSEDSIFEQEKLFKENLEEAMPDLVPDEAEKKRYSF